MSKTIIIKSPEDYKTIHRVNYDSPKRLGYTVISVLDFLKGRPWDEIALGYVHSLRPSSIRVTPGECTLDANLWRVTVYVNKNDTIRNIEQEVEVGLPESIEHGHALNLSLNDFF